MDITVLQALKDRATNELERPVIAAEGHIATLADLLNQCTAEAESDQVLLALEVICLLSMEAALRPRLASQPELVNNVKKLMSRGRLKQKKIALATFKNLQGVATTSAAREDIVSPLTEITESENNENNAPPIMSPLLVGKNSTFTRNGGNSSAFGGKTPARPSLRARATVAAAASTVTIYVEGMNTVEIRTEVENSLLRKDGVISFFTDMSEEKIVVRTTCTFEDLQAHICQNCQRRVSGTKGDYSACQQPSYLDDSNKQNGWFSSILQIIAVKPNEQPGVQQKGAPRPQAAVGGNNQQGWLGGWW